MLDDICGDTHYQIVYQEQILRIVREIGNFDWTAASYIRKIISRKIGEQEFNRQWDKFWDGAQSHGMDEDTARAIWGQCITAGSYAFNVAHSTSYGMLAWWTMYIKRHHPVEFFTASLRKYGSKKQAVLLRDALRHGIQILPPSVRTPGTTWYHEPAVPDAIFAGFSQVPGIGDVMAQRISESKPESWDDLIKIKGVGKKTIEKIKEFCSKDDPFDIMKLDRAIKEVIEYVRSHRLGVPIPTHTSEQVPYSRSTNDTLVVWAGVIQHRNLRELFEVNFSRTGVPLDPATVKDPDKTEWVIMVGADDSEQLTITIDRYKYPAFKKAVWDLKLGEDIVVIRGIKKGYQSRRAINVLDMWVFGEDEEEEDAGDDTAGLE